MLGDTCHDDAFLCPPRLAVGSWSRQGVPETLRRGNGEVTVLLTVAAAGDHCACGIAVLGPVTVDVDAAVLGPRDRVVLAALALHPGDMMSAERLADALWGERDHRRRCGPR